MLADSGHALVLAGPVLVGLVLLVAAWLKAADPTPFLDHVGRLGLVPLHTTGWFALGLVGLEAALGTALVIRWRTDLLLPGTIVVLLVLSTVAWWGTATGRTEDCGCYNGLVELSSRGSLALNAGYAALLLAAWLAGGPTRPTAPWAPVLIAAAGALPIAVAWRAVRYGRFLVDPSPIRVGRRWRPGWLPGHPPGLLEGEQVVVFLSPTCPRCAEWIPVLNAVGAGPGLPGVVGCAVLEPDAILAFMDRHRIRFPVVVTPRRVHARAVRMVPTAFLLEDGVVRDRWIGGMPEAFLERVRRTLGAGTHRGVAASGPDTGDPRPSAAGHA